MWDIFAIADDGSEYRIATVRSSFEVLDWQLLILEKLEKRARYQRRRI